MHVPAQALAKLHPAGLSDDWADKLAGQDFFSRAQKATFEHYMQAKILILPPAAPAFPHGCLPCGVLRRVAAHSMCAGISMHLSWRGLPWAPH